MSDRSDERNVAAATHTLAQLEQQADGVRAELRSLQQDLRQARSDFSGTRAAVLLEANEQLVLAALRAQTLAETAVSDLDELARASQRDTLTDTPNRALMLDRLEHAIAVARRRQTRVAVLFLDLDDFKPINDTLGHAVGDAVLQQVARRLELAVRHSDTVSRHGGDEFLLLLADVAQPSDAALIATKMLGALAEPFHVDGQALSLSASLGIAIYPEDGEDAAALIGRADVAMYRAKNSERGSFEFYRKELANGVDLGPSPAGTLREQAAGRTPARDVGAPDLRQLREANEQLVLAAMGAHELEESTAVAHRKQIAFLAMVAHELRNPLAPIRTAVELLNRGPDATMLARLQVIIRRQVAQMTRLVEDLLDGARISTGKFRLELGTVDMADVLAQAVETCRAAMFSRHQDFTMSLPPGPLRVRGDAVRLAQVFTNLLDNACKYTPSEGRIALAATLHERSLVVSVSDNGIGVTAEALPRVFDLFVQDPHALSFYKGGLGIGLAIVRELVEGHGGTVVGKSAGKDLGSEFIVTLPLADAPGDSLPT